MSLKEFSGAVAVITGGASGIGKATAHALYAHGAHVVIADLNKRALVPITEELHTISPHAQGDIITFALDVTDETQVQTLMRQAAEINGNIDLVVTSAGLGKGGPIDIFSGMDMQRLMDVNFMGTYHSVRAALPYMRQQGSGHFVLLSSVAGKLPPPLLTGYVATKWAIRGFSSALRAELYGSGIDVTTIYPAWVDTPMIHQEESLNMHIEALLTPEIVADEIIKGIEEGRSDVTLAPNKDIAYVLQMMKEDESKAEQMMGMSFYKQQHNEGSANSANS